MSIVGTIASLGHPVAFYPALTTLTRSTTATLFLCQLMYWHGKQHHPAGWIFKSRVQMEAETGLTRTEQDTARKALVGLGFIEERRMGQPATMHYRLKPEAIDAAWNALQTRLQESRNLDGRNLANQIAGIPQTISETTQRLPTETTSPRRDSATAWKASDVMARFAEYKGGKIDPAIRSMQAGTAKRLIQGTKSRPGFSYADITGCMAYLEAGGRPWTLIEVERELPRWIAEERPERPRKIPSQYTTSTTDRQAGNASAFAEYRRRRGINTDPPEEPPHAAEDYIDVDWRNR